MLTNENICATILEVILNIIIMFKEIKLCQENQKL
jgi:hypothetical protein